MNKVILLGRLVANPDVRYSQGNEPMAIARYRLAVDRRKNSRGEQETDFISCVAFGRNGEFAEKYLHKGTKVCVCGRIQTGSYEKDGQKVYTTDVVAEEHYFAESKSNSNSNENVNSNSNSNNGQTVDSDGFMSIPDDVAEDLPFV